MYILLVPLVNNINPKLVLYDGKPDIGKAAMKKISENEPESFEDKRFFFRSFYLFV